MVKGVLDQQLDLIHLLLKKNQKIVVILEIINYICYMNQGRRKSQTEFSSKMTFVGFVGIFLMIIINLIFNFV